MSYAPLPFLCEGACITNPLPRFPSVRVPCGLWAVLFDSPTLYFGTVHKAPRIAILGIAHAAQPPPHFWRDLGRSCHKGQRARSASPTRNPGDQVEWGTAPADLPLQQGQRARSTCPTRNPGGQVEWGTAPAGLPLKQGSGGTRRRGYVWNTAQTK